MATRRTCAAGPVGERTLWTAEYIRPGRGSPSAVAPLPPGCAPRGRSAPRGGGRTLPPECAPRSRCAPRGGGRTLHGGGARAAGRGWL